MFETVATYHQCDVTSKGIEKRSIVYCAQPCFLLLLLPMKENELPNSPTKKPMECLPSQTLDGSNLTLENTAHFINTLKEN
jgi:hypothetical protein